ncbi:MAG: class I SAM-dependent methyltransferase [Fibrobacter sp.]|nr:class I SAM-dependent methyltransferase [Fibrobacter sp.]
MSKNIWNVFAPVYEFSMRTQKNIYDFLYARIAEVAKGKDVLELATGPGMIARHIAPAAKSVVATDLAPKMIETALKAKNPKNLSFEVADATSLRFEDNSFDVVVIANALHIIPNPEKALAEIRRVLKDDGLLIAPNYLLNVGGMKNLWKKILNLIGIRFAHEWTANEFKAFLESNGWSIKMDRVIEGRIDLIYVECKRSSVS